MRTCRDIIRSGISAVAVFATLALALSACDTAGEEGDPFVGSWTVSRININGQDYTTLLFGSAEIDEMGATFAANGSFQLIVDAGGERTVTAGTYTRNRGSSTIRFSSESFSAPIEMSYSTAGASTIVLSSDDPALLAEMSGVDFAEMGLQIDQVEVTIRRE